MLDKLKHHWNVSRRREFFTQAGSGLAAIFPPSDAAALVRYRTEHGASKPWLAQPFARTTLIDKRHHWRRSAA